MADVGADTHALPAHCRLSSMVVVGADRHAVLARPWLRSLRRGLGSTAALPSYP